MKYTYNGEQERDFPTLGLTLKPGDTFDAPKDFVPFPNMTPTPQGEK
jgi:hypothetical protein